EPEGKKSDWNGFAKYDFVVDGRTSYLVVPKEAASGKPWIWRARFWGHEPQTDIALLKKGYHLASCDVVELFGNPQAIKHWNVYYEHVTTKYGLAPKIALQGMSR